MAKSNLRLVTPDSELRTVALKGSFRVNVLLSIESAAVRIAKAQRKQHASNQNPTYQKLCVLRHVRLSNSILPVRLDGSRSRGHTRPLTDGQPDPRPMVDRSGEDLRALSRSLPAKSMCSTVFVPDKLKIAPSFFIRRRLGLSLAPL
jgi:hypothetical protein